MTDKGGNEPCENPYANRLRAADWDVRAIPTHAEAVAFIEVWHYGKGAPVMSVARHGLYRVDAPDELAGVALWLPPTKRAALTVSDDHHAVLCLSRFAVHPDAPRNAASFLLGRSMKMIDRARWPVLLTYADTGHEHTGGIYKATNWTLLGETPGGDIWTTPDGVQRGRKRGKRNLTVAEMLSMGCTRNPSAPKIKFVHKVAVRRQQDRAELGQQSPAGGEGVPMSDSGRPAGDGAE